MKLVVVSHPCSNPQNQLFFQRLIEVSGWQITIITPSVWRTEYGNRAVTTKHNTFEGNLRRIAVFLSGNIPLHFYSFRVLSVLLAEQPDWIYVQNEPYALSTIEVILLNKLFVRAKTAFYSAQNINKKYPWLFRKIEQFNYRSTNLALPVTESAAECLRQKGYSNKLSVLPIGVNESYLNGDQNNEESVDIPIVGYIGRLVPEKGVDELIKALALIGNLKWQCSIAGDGPMRNDLIKLCEELKILGRVKFTGYIPHGEMHVHIKSLSVLVLPSRTLANWKEQFGRVLIEALAVGVPVIGTDSGEIPFLIRKLQGGIVVNEGDTAGLSEAIYHLLNNKDERRKFAEMGRHNVRRYFLDRELAKQFVAALQG